MIEKKDKLLKSLLMTIKMIWAGSFDQAKSLVSGKLRKWLIRL